MQTSAFYLTILKYTREKRWVNIMKMLFTLYDKELAKEARRFPFRYSGIKWLHQNWTWENARGRYKFEILFLQRANVPHPNCPFRVKTRVQSISSAQKQENEMRMTLVNFITIICIYIWMIIVVDEQITEWKCQMRNVKINMIHH